MKFLNWLLNPQWVVFKVDNESQEELGLKIWGVIFGLWKGNTLPYSKVAHERRPGKREFGECLKKPN